jgi:RNA polymerase sigma factor (sigma-70 family)
MKKPTLAARAGRSSYVVAVVLGTALSTMGSAPGTAVAESTTATVNDLSRYCTACWRNARIAPDRWTDCTQEVFRRLLERVGVDAWERALKGDGEERSELVRAIDTVKKRIQRERKRQAYHDELAADGRELRERSLRDDRDAVSRAAADLLSPRQQTIVQKSFQGWSVQDLAAQLRLPPERVSDEKYKAICKLRQHFTTTA